MAMYANIGGANKLLAQTSAEASAGGGVIQFYYIGDGTGGVTGAGASDFDDIESLDNGFQEADDTTYRTITIPSPISNLLIFSNRFFGSGSIFKEFNVGSKITVNLGNRYSGSYAVSIARLTSSTSFQVMHHYTTTSSSTRYSFNVNNETYLCIGFLA